MKDVVDMSNCDRLMWGGVTDTGDVLSRSRRLTHCQEDQESEERTVWPGHVSSGYKAMRRGKESSQNLLLFSAMDRTVEIGWILWWNISCLSQLINVSSAPYQWCHFIIKLFTTVATQHQRLILLSWDHTMKYCFKINTCWMHFLVEDCQ